MRHDDQAAASISKINFLQRPGIFLGEFHIPPSGRSNAAFGAVLGKYVVFVLRGNDKYSVTPDVLGGSISIRDFCANLRRRVPGLKYQPQNLLRDLPNADIDILALSEAFAEPHEHGLPKVETLLAGIDNFFQSLGNHFGQDQQAFVLRYFQKQASDVIAKLGHDVPPLYSSWLPSLRSSYEISIGHSSLENAVIRTEWILERSDEERIREFRNLWSQLYRSGDIAALDRSLRVSKEKFGDSPQWSIGAANCSLALWRLDEASYYLQQARDRFACGNLDEKGEVSIAHLTAKLALQRFEQAEPVELQAAYLDAAIDACKSVPYDSDILKLVRANTLTRRAFNCYDIETKSWNRFRDDETRAWCDEADKLFLELDSSEEKDRALIGRCYLHHLSAAFGYGQTSESGAGLLRRLEQYVDAGDSRRDFAAIAMLTYCKILSGEMAAASVHLRRAELSHFSERRDQQAMWCSLLGYLFSNNSGRKKSFRYHLVNFIRSQSVRVEYNMEPILIRSLLPEPVGMHKELLRTCRLGKGLTPLTAFGDDFISFVSDTDI